MRLIILIVYALSVTSCITSNMLNEACNDKEFIYWEDLPERERERVLNTFKIDKDAVDYYYGKFTLSDNEETMKLLETITSTNEQKEITNFYFYIFNQICLKADGAISEIIGKYCQKIIENDPLYTVNYFNKSKKMLEIYANFIGYELYFKKEGTSDIEYNFNDFKKLIEEKVIPKEKYSEILSKFFEEIEISMENTD